MNIIIFIKQIRKSGIKEAKKFVPDYVAGKVRPSHNLNPEPTFKE
jgi:hypothetical protein